MSCREPIPPGTARVEGDPIVALRKVWHASWIAPALVIAAALALHGAEPLPFQLLRHTVFDQYQRWQPRTIDETPVQIVDIDDHSLKQLGQWPWPRTKMAQLVDTLRQAGATAIALDIIFAEPDRTSPQAALKDWGFDGALARQIAALPDHDTVLAQALANANAVLGFALDDRQALTSLPPRPYNIVTQGTAPQAALPAYTGAILPLAQLEQAAAGSGVISFHPDADGVVRRVPLMFLLDGKVTPSFAAETLRVAQGASQYILHGLSGPNRGLAQVRIGAYPIPTTAQGEVWLHYRHIDSSRYLPAWKLLSGQADPATLRGRIVMVGTSAQGLKDLHASPLDSLMPGIEAHAQFLEQALSGSFLTRPGWAMAAEALAIVLGGLLLTLLTLAGRRYGALLASACTGVCMALTLALSWLAFARQGVLLDPVMPVLCMLLIHLCASVQQHRASERRQRWVKSVFSRYVSPNLVAHLVNNPDQLELGGRRQSCSFIFTDLANFTDLMEDMDPGQAVALLNDYLDRMIAIAFRHEGTLDRIVGDALAIMFSAPVEQADHPRRAFACALEMQRFASAYARTQNRKGIAFGQTRIGVHSGEVIVGNFGGPTIFDYRALGDPVNTAARLEALNKTIGTWICISAATLAGCPQAITRPAGDFILKGKSRPLSVHEPLLDQAGAPAQCPDRDYEAAYALLEHDSAQARLAFAHLHAARPGDGLVAFHLRRLQRGEQGKLVVMSGK